MMMNPCLPVAHSPPALARSRAIAARIPLRARVALLALLTVAILSSHPGLGEAHMPDPGAHGETLAICIAVLAQGTQAAASCRFSSPTVPSLEPRLAHDVRALYRTSAPPLAPAGGRARAGPSVLQVLRL